VGAGINSLTWSNSLWHVPDATILLAGNLSCYTCAQLNSALHLGGEVFVGAGVVGL
jgi:cation transporter-like permease